MLSTANKGSKGDILIVDDAPDNVRVLSQILSLFNYKVRSVNDGHQALIFLQNNTPDLIMLDINMPGIDGYETCRRIKANDIWRGIPIIFISAMGETDDKVKAFRAGGVDYVTKPFQIEEVLARIDTHLSILRLQKQLQAANRELANRLDELSLARSHEHEQRLLAETLRDITAAINQSLDVDEVLDLILDNLARVLPHDTANITLLDANRRMRLVRGRGYEKFGAADLAKNLDLPIDSFPLWEQSLRQHTTLVIPDIFDEPDWRPIHGFEWIRSAILAPIQTNTERLGFLNVESAVTGFFTSEHGERLQIFANQAAVAIEKASLFQETQRLAIEDALTGLPNRRHVLQQAQDEFARARRYDRPLSALMIDLDHFKQINDTYGHPVGDQVLQAVAACLRLDLRNTDIYGRYGGEEFLVLLPETPTEAALEVAERIREVVENLALVTDKGTPRITISGGMATLTPDQDWNLDDLIRYADDTLYAAKADGRNRVYVFRTAGQQEIISTGAKL